MRLQLWKSIDSRLILNTKAVAAENDTSIEYQCTVQCPACPKKCLANYKSYSVGGRMRKRKIAKEKVVGNRHPTWYITNLRTHLTTSHIQDRILHEVSLSHEADLQSSVPDLIDYDSKLRYQQIENTRKGRNWKRNRLYKWIADAQDIPSQHKPLCRHIGNAEKVNGH